MLIFFLTLKKGNEWVWHAIDKCAAHGNHQVQLGQNSFKIDYRTHAIITRS